MATIKDWLGERGVEVVVISFAKPERLGAYQERKHWPFLLVSDPGRSAYARFQLERLPWTRLFNLRMLREYWRLWRKGRRLEKYQGEDIYQAGGDFLIDAQGELLYAHRSHDPADRPTLDELRRAVEEARSKSSCR